MLLAFLIAIAGQVGISKWSSDQGGDPRSLMMGYDWQGNKCESDKPYVMWPDVSQFNFRECVSSCEATTNNDPAYEIVTCGTNGKYGYDSELWVDMWCFPSTDTIQEKVGKGLGGFQFAMADVITAQYSIWASIAVALLVSFLYVSWLRCGASCLIWGSLVTISVGGGMLGGIMVYKSDEAKAVGWDQSADVMKWVGVIIIILDLIFIITMCCLRKRIELACELVGEAGRALAEIPTLIIFPVFELILQVAYFAFWVIISMYIFSIYKISEDEPIPNDTDPTCGLLSNTRSLLDIYQNKGATTFVDRDWNRSHQNVFIYHLFVGFWVYEFINYWSYSIVAGAYAEWYFSPWATRDYSSKAMNSSMPLLNSVWRTTRYHLGTIAFGSLIIAIINTIRSILLYIQSKTEGTENCILQCIFSCIQCILGCLECCIDKINKTGFVFTNIYGIPYCGASVKAFDLIASHLDYVAAISVVTHIFMLLGKLVISVSTAGIMLLAIQNFNIYDNHEISSLGVIGIVIFMLAYIIAVVFLGVFDTGIDAIFVCFIADLDQNRTPKFAHPDMADIFGRNSEESILVAEKMKRMRTGTKSNAEFAT